MMSNELFIQKSRYYLATEYPAKIRLAVSPLEHGVVWWRANQSSNSIGNLLVHLAGNIRQWIVGGVGGHEVSRDRASEFAMRDGDGAKRLIADLETATTEADSVLAALDPDSLSREVLIQGRNTTVLSAVYHVVEHFSMHTGQILLIAKMHAPGSVKFYEDAGGLAVPIWGGSEGMEPEAKGRGRADDH